MKRLATAFFDDPRWPCLTKGLKQIRLNRRTLESGKKNPAIIDDGAKFIANRRRCTLFCLSIAMLI